MPTDKWSVSVMLKGRNGDFTHMNYLTKGDRFEAVHSVMAAIQWCGEDSDWVTIEQITITAVKEA